MTYDKKYNLFDAVYNGCSAMFSIADKEDFIIRLDTQTGTIADDNNLAVRISLVNCSGYMHLIKNARTYQTQFHSKQL